MIDVTYKKRYLIFILVCGIFMIGVVIGCSNNTVASSDLPEGYAPTLYTDVGVSGLTNVGKHTVVEFFTKSQFSNIPFSDIKSASENQDVFAVVFEDNSALIYVYKYDRIYFGKYDSENLKLELAE